MKIPKKIEIIIQNQHNEIVEKEIVFGIKIYKSKDSYLNISPLKTEENGKKIILQNQIFEYLTSENNFDDFESNKIEIEIWDTKIINDVFESVKALSSKTQEQLKKELVNLGFDEEFAQKHSLNSYKKLQKDFPEIYTKEIQGTTKTTTGKTGCRGGGKSNAAYPVTNSKYLYYFSRKESGRFEHPDNYFYFCGLLKRIILKSNNELVW